jgi:hypothetical protein
MKSKVATIERKYISNKERERGHYKHSWYASK